MAIERNQKKSLKERSCVLSKLPSSKIILIALKQIAERNEFVWQSIPTFIISGLTGSYYIIVLVGNVNRGCKHIDIRNKNYYKQTKKWDLVVFGNFQTLSQIVYIMIVVVALIGRRKIYRIISFA